MADNIASKIELFRPRQSFDFSGKYKNYQNVNLRKVNYGKS